jgi:DNA-binding transcriptional LysR family regulator
MSQPAISRQLHDLEAELGVALFERAGRTLRLTGAGEYLLAHGRKVLRETEAFVEQARALHAGDSGVLRVGATPQTLERLFPSLLRHCARVLPGVAIQLTEGHPGTLFELVRKGDLQLAITQHQPQLRSGFRALAVVPLLAIRKATRTRLRNDLELRALQDVPLLLLRPGFGSRDLFDAACHMARLRVDVFLESSAVATLLALARAGCGVAVLPGTVAVPSRGLSVQRLVQDDGPIEMPIGVHWNEQRLLPPYARRFIEELVLHARREYATATPARP